MYWGNNAFVYQNQVSNVEHNIKTNCKIKESMLNYSFGYSEMDYNFILLYYLIMFVGET
jgi:hypothetical protein